MHPGAPQGPLRTPSDSSGNPTCPPGTLTRSPHLTLQGRLRTSRGRRLRSKDTAGGQEGPEGGSHPHRPVCGHLGSASSEASSGAEAATGTWLEGLLRKRQMKRLQGVV